MAGSSSPDWTDTVRRLCLSESDEEVFHSGSPNRRRSSHWPGADDRTDTPQSPGLEHPDLESCAVPYDRQYVRTFSESGSSIEDLRHRRPDWTPAVAAAASWDCRESQTCGGGESESALRVRSMSDQWTETAPARVPHVHKLERQRSIVDGLLLEIYDRSHRRRADSVDSDTVTECSSVSEAPFARWDSGHCYHPGGQHSAKRYNRHRLQSYSVSELQCLVQEGQRSVTQMSLRLVRHLTRRDRRLARMSRHCDVITAVLQAASLKRQIDTRMKFSLAPPAGPSAFEQWKDAMKAVNRLPLGIPADFRKKVWLSLADRYIRQLKIDWHHTLRLAFNDRSNPDDDKLGMQIVKDLHRTGCSSFSGQDNEEDRAVLKRVLLAYARWNKRIGYCQGFNVIVALLLDVMDRKEDDALKVMIYLVDHVLPESYFDNNLRALSVDMAVFRDLLRMTLPALSAHLDHLQAAAQDLGTGASYEPPLTNVFTMQWFLTLFATCLPKDVVLRVWDAILLEGSEVMLRTALSLWAKLARRIMTVDSADEFYSLMGEMSSDMMEGSVFDSDEMIKEIYAVAPFPFPQLTELREKYTYNIRPFSSTSAPTPSPSRRLSRLTKAVVDSDEDEPDEEELRALAALPGMAASPSNKAAKNTDISVVGPGVFGGEREVVGGGGKDTVYMERMTTDLTALTLQYNRLRLRQRQAHVIIAAAVSARQAVEVKQKSPAPVLMTRTQPMNHLLVAKAQGRNRVVTKGPGFTMDSAPSNNRAPGNNRQVPAQTSDLGSSWSCPPASSPTASLGSCSMSFGPETKDSNSRKTLLECLEEPARFCMQDPEMSPSLHATTDHTTDHTTTDHTTITDQARRGHAGLVSEAGGLVSAVSSSDCCEVQEKKDHPPSVCWEKQVVDSGCLEQGEEDQLPQSSLCADEDRNDDTESDQILQGPHVGGKDSDDFPRHRLCSREEGVSYSHNGPTRPLHFHRLHCVKCEQTPEITPSPKNQQSNCHHTVTCAQSAPKTDRAADGEGVGKRREGVQPSHITISRSHSLPTPSLLSPPPSPSPSRPFSTPPGVKIRHVSTPSAVSRCPRPFQPLGVKQMGVSRVRTGLKLGLYSPSSLQHIQGQVMGRMALKKASHASS